MGEKSLSFSSENAYRRRVENRLTEEFCSGKRYFIGGLDSVGTTTVDNHPHSIGRWRVQQGNFSGAGGGRFLEKFSISFPSFFCDTSHFGLCRSGLVIPFIMAVPARIPRSAGAQSFLS